VICHPTLADRTDIGLGSATATFIRWERVFGLGDARCWADSRRDATDTVPHPSTEASLSRQRSAHGDFQRRYSSCPMTLRRHSPRTHRRPVRDHAHHPVRAAVEGRTRCRTIGTKDLEQACVPERRKYQALAFLVSRSEIKRWSGLLQARWDAHKPRDATGARTHEDCYVVSCAGRSRR